MISFLFLLLFFLIQYLASKVEGWDEASSEIFAKQKIQGRHLYNWTAEHSNVLGSPLELPLTSSLLSQTIHSLPQQSSLVSLLSLTLFILDVSCSLLLPCVCCAVLISLPVFAAMSRWSQFQENPWQYLRRWGFPWEAIILRSRWSMASQLCKGSGSSLLQTRHASAHDSPMPRLSFYLHPLALEKLGQFWRKFPRQRASTLWLKSVIMMDPLISRTCWMNFTVEPSVKQWAKIPSKLEASFGFS